MKRTYIYNATRIIDVLSRFAPCTNTLIVYLIPYAHGDIDGKAPGLSGIKKNTEKSNGATSRFRELSKSSTDRYERVRQISINQTKWSIQKSLDSCISPLFRFAPLSNFFPRSFPHLSENRAVAKTLPASAWSSRCQ